MEVFSTTFSKEKKGKQASKKEKFSVHVQKNVRGATTTKKTSQHAFRKNAGTRAHAAFPARRTDCTEREGGARALHVVLCNVTAV